MSQIDFEKALNAEQLAAVQAPDGPVLVIAAAGTGKTRTLTYRVAWLVEHQIDASQILLLTFTNRAAREMLERAQALVGAAVGGLWGGTFHHMANRMLRRHAQAIGYKSDYTILDQDDSRTLVRTCADELDLLGKHFPKPDVLQSVFSLSVNREEPVEKTATGHFEDSLVAIEDIVKVHEAYQARKKTLNAMDFDDLLANGLKLFRDHPSILEQYQHRFLYTLVDEYQDTNTIQAEWVDRIAAHHRNLLVVGDDFQSIYSWRGADFRNIMSFPKRYADASVFKLETNYRSVPGILEVANACIAGNPEQFQKNLKAVREATVKPVCVQLHDGGQQARYVVDRIRRLLRKGVSMKDMVVLYRSHFHAMELQMELAREGMPYEVTSGVRFFEQAHIKDVCTLLRLFFNAEDELAFMRLLKLFPKVGEKTCIKLWEKLGRQVNLRNAEQLKWIREHLPAAAARIWETLEPVIIAYETEHLRNDPGEFIFRFVKTFYREYAIETFDNHDRRLDDIDELMNFTARFESAEQFLSEIALQTNLDAEIDEMDAAEQNRIRLTTVHQAKGLEWKVVFVLWMSDGMFPSSRSLSDSGAEAEERRLFYVASTRAKDELYLCVPEMRRMRDGGVMNYPPSRFIREINPDLLQNDFVGYI
ncbi:MAG TPA: hypothetical protein DCZ95_17310 [Verrucomicrobia bacterium]|nr:MAG: hypothetical protein A2X46_17380 [Lentisphaerae bacterium GWF2_57_35]HBA85844.1 hypothetical protein [Verrucomicrobiota bacterium]